MNQHNVMQDRIYRKLNYRSNGKTLEKQLGISKMSGAFCENYTRI